MILCAGVTISGSRRRRPAFTGCASQLAEELPTVDGGRTACGTNGPSSRHMVYEELCQDPVCWKLLGEPWILRQRAAVISQPFSNRNSEVVCADTPAIPNASRETESSCRGRRNSAVDQEVRCETDWQESQRVTQSYFCSSAPL